MTGAIGSHQKVNYWEFEGHKCTMHCSKMSYECMWKSHIILGTVPETNRLVILETDECAHMVRTNT